MATSAGNGSEVNSPIYSMMKRFQSGFSHGVRVNLGFLENFLSTSFVSKLLFKSENPHWPEKSSGINIKSTYLRKMPVRKVLQPKEFVNELVTNQKIDLTQVALVPVGRRKRTESMTDQNSPVRCRLTDTQKVLGAVTLQEQARFLTLLSKPLN